MLDYFIIALIAFIIIPFGIIALLMPMPREKRVIFVFVFLVIGIFTPLFWFLHWKSEKLFDQLTQQTFTQVTFQREKQEAVIKEAAEINKFLTILKTAPEVHAHHSSPVGKVVVIFAGRRERFLLGADSGNQDEYWFELENGYYNPLKQFHSAELTLWLRQNAVPLMKPPKKPDRAFQRQSTALLPPASRLPTWGSTASRQKAARDVRDGPALRARPLRRLSVEPDVPREAQPIKAARTNAPCEGTAHPPHSASADSRRFAAPYSMTFSLTMRKIYDRVIRPLLHRSDNL